MSKAFWKSATLVTGLLASSGGSASFSEHCVLRGKTVSFNQAGDGVRQVVPGEFALLVETAITLPGSQRNCRYWLGKTVRGQLRGRTTASEYARLTIEYQYHDSLCEPGAVCRSVSYRHLRSATEQRDLLEMLLAP